jgi:hypothetical protein
MRRNSAAFASNWLEVRCDSGIYSPSFGCDPVIECFGG